MAPNDNIESTDIQSVIVVREVPISRMFRKYTKG